MAKIGGMELIVILIVALFAIGPERLPKAARMLGRAVGSFKKYMNEATSELREVSDEFKEVTNEIASAQKTMKDAFLDVEDDIKKTGREIDKKVNATEPAKAAKKAKEEAKPKEETKEEAKSEGRAEPVAQAGEATKTADDSEQQNAAAAV